jgi:glycosyltransferase involved in cell wall biosynthesis
VTVTPVVGGPLPASRRPATLGTAMLDIDASAIRTAPAAPAPAPERRRPVVRPELSVVMPCLNEARTVATCVAKARAFFDRAGIDGEVVVADNGSTDGSRELAVAAGARVVAVAERGYGAALLGGIRAARGRWVVMGDADDSYDFGALDGFVERLRAGAQLVMGNRFAGGNADGAMPPLHRYHGNPVLSFVGRLLFRSPIGDFHCGLRAFDRDAILALGLASPGMEFASEMVMRATLAGLRVDEVPTTLAKDGRDRPPHLRSWRDGWRHLRLLLMFSPRWLLLYPGLALLFAGTLASFALTLGPIRIGGVGFDIHTLLYCATASVLGLQLSVLAVVAKAAGVSVGHLPPGARFEKLMSAFTLERGLVLGLGMVVLGFGMGVASVLGWAHGGLAALDPTRTMRAAIPSATLMLAGAECMFASFVLSFLVQRRADERVPAVAGADAPSAANRA